MELFNIRPNEKLDVLLYIVLDFQYAIMYMSKYNRQLDNNLTDFGTLERPATTNLDIFVFRATRRVNVVTVSIARTIACRKSQHATMINV